MWVDTSSGVLRPLVPEKWRRRVFAAIHELAHPGIRATRRLIGSRYVWLQLAKDVAAWCRDCTTCQAAKVTQHHAAKVQPIPTPVQRFTHLHVDLVGPLPTSLEGFSYIFTIIERTTHWLEAVPLRSTAAADIADALVSGWVMRFGLPAQPCIPRAV
jgi:hypothetical protein